MKVLAFDTALSGCSAAFYDAQRGKSFYEQEPMQRGQSEALVPMIGRVMDEAGAPLTALDLIVTTVGPGAFTGLRIGIAAAQGLGLALDRPVTGVSVPEVLAAMYFGKEKLADGQLLGVVIETKREDFYCQFYRPDGSAQTEPQALPAEKIRDIAGDAVFIGDGVARFGGGVREGYDLPDPRIVAVKGLKLYKGGAGRPVKPLYLRGADVSAPKKQNREILGGDTLFK